LVLLTESQRVEKAIKHLSLRLNHVNVDEKQQFTLSQMLHLFVISYQKHVLQLQLQENQ